MEPMHHQGGAASSGIDQVAIRRINAPAGKAPFGPAAPERQAAVRHQRVRQGSARQAARSCSSGTRRKARQRQAQRHRRCAASASRSARTRRGSIGFDGLFIIKPDGRVYVPVGHRQPRHALGDRRASRRRRDARRAVGEGATSSGATRQEPAVDLHLGRQPDDARDDARGARRRRPTRSRSCRRSPRKMLGGNARRLQGRRRARHRGPGGSMTLRAGGAEGDRARRQVRRPRAARGHQRVHQDVGDGARRPGTDGRRARTPTRATAQTHSFVVGFAEVEVDVETGKCHDRRLPGGRRRRHGASTRAACSGQTLRRLDARHRPRHRRRSGSTTSTTACRWRKRFYQNKPPTILDAPQKINARRGRTCRIRKRRSARAASASRRSARATARC